MAQAGEYDSDSFTAESISNTHLLETIFFVKIK